MPEPDVTPDVTPEPPKSIVGEDGNFVEDWHKSLSDETLHDNEALKQIKNINGLAKSYVFTKKMVGKDKVAVPTEASDEAEWDAWYTAGGRPDTAADYNFIKPEEFPEELWSNDRAMNWMDFFHKIGLNSKQAKAIFDKNNGEVLLDAKAKNDAIETHRQEIKDGLYKDWGAAYESNKHLGDYAVTRGTKDDEEFRARLVDKFGDDPDFIRYSSNLGALFAEHGDVVASKVPTPGDIQEQIAQIMSDPNYTHRDVSKRKPLMDKVMRLREQLDKQRR